MITNLMISYQVSCALHPRGGVTGSKFQMPMTASLMCSVCGFQYQPADGILGISMFRFNVFKCQFRELFMERYFPDAYRKSIKSSRY